jgi:Family of unknown function (DUF5519)
MFTNISTIFIPTTSTHFALPPLLLLSSTLLPLLALYTIARLADSIAKDYAIFLSLGPGGTPSTPQGYLRIKFLSLFALKDPYSPTLLAVAPVLQGRLPAPLPPRRGPRPQVAGIAPHRQRTQHAPPQAFSALRMSIESLARTHPRLISRTSCLEKHGPGLFVLPGGAWGEQTARLRCGGEVCHAHPSDGSLHLTLHPADEAAVLAAGWGELHPLARGGWLTRFVPSRFMMVYAPRDEDELRVVLGIVKAAVWWVGGVEVGGEDNDEGNHDDVVSDLELEMEGTACCVDTAQKVMIMT